MMRLFRVFFILFLLCTWSFAGGNMRVTGTGSTPQDARTAAYKNGLWQYSKGFLDSDVIKKRRGDILSILLRTPSVFIGSEELLSEKNEYGLYTVQMNLTVKEEPLVSAFRDAGMLSTGKIQKPSVMILVDEYAQGEESMDNTVTYLLEERLTKQGYRVLEQKQLEKNAEDNTDLARFAFSSGADIIVRGRVTTGKTRVKEIYGVEQVSVPVKINVRALRADNAEIITSVSKNIMKRTMDEFSAREEGLREGGTIVADHLDKAVAAYWKHSISGLKHIELQAESKNSAALKGIGEAFSGLASVKGLSIRYLEDQRALYDMRVMGTMQNLRRDLEKSGQWKVVAVAPGKIALESAATAGEMQYGIPAPDLSIVSANVADIFPSRMKYYEDNPLSEIVLELNTGALEDLTVSVMIPRIMDAPSQKRVNLTAGQEDTVKMNLLLNEKALLDITSEKKVPAKISLTYYRQGREFTRNLAVPVKVYSVNGMNWNETAGIGAFVTYQNTLVDRLARQAVSSYEKGPLEDQFEDAVSIFGALRQYGITYVKDPVNVAGSGLDKIQYPVETLEKKSGDCDDSSVLYASLLSAVGIPAAFIVYDDHVLVMFDTGIYSKNADRLGYDKKNLVIHKDRCWIPVETTLLTKSFFEAWTAAAEEFQQALADKEDIDIVECADAWQTYRPFDYGRAPGGIAFENVEQAVRSELVLVEKNTDDILRKMIAHLESRETLDFADRNRLGKLYAAAGMYEKALAHFETFLDEKDTYVTRNNYACAMILSGNEKDALRQVEKSLAMKQSDEATVNKALCYYLASDQQEGVEKFIATLQRLNSRMSDPSRLNSLLGMEVTAVPKERAGEHNKATAQTIDKSRLKELIRKRVISRDVGEESADSYSGNVMPFGGVRGADPTQVAQIADLICWMGI